MLPLLCRWQTTAGRDAWGWAHCNDLHLNCKLNSRVFCFFYASTCTDTHSHVQISTQMVLGMAMQEAEGKRCQVTEQTWKNKQVRNNISEVFVKELNLTRGTELPPDRLPPIGWPGLLLPPSEEAMPVCVSWPVGRWSWWAPCTSWAGWWCACRCDDSPSWSRPWRRPWSWRETWRRSETEGKKGGRDRKTAKQRGRRNGIRSKIHYQWNSNNDGERRALVEVRSVPMPWSSKHTKKREKREDRLKKEEERTCEEVSVLAVAAL